jgi:predicted dehydrogenase
MNRRHFLMSTAAVAAGAVTKGVASPNDTIRIACVGLHGQGKSHIQAYSKIPNVEIAKLCDIDENVLGDRLKEFEKRGKKKPETEVDFRKLLDDKSIDAVSIATPNFHHTLQTIWALQAGKHVYVEKPCSYNMFEAKQIVAAARKHDKLLVQHGTNSRSSPALKEAMQKLREGVIGDVYMARGLCYKWRDTIGRAPVEPVPAGVHYDLWQGPAPEHPFTKNRFHYNWHWFWDYGNGDLGNQGIHEIDVARWGLNVQHPTKVSAIGGHFMFDDDQETPNTLNVAYEFHDGGKLRMMEFEVRHWMSNNEAGIGKHGPNDPNTIGNLFYGADGYMAIDGYGTYKTYLGKKNEPGPSGDEPGDNWANFIDALRAGDKKKLNAPIEEGALSVELVHLANLSYRTGRTLHFDAEKFAVTGDSEATRMFTRNYRKGWVVPEKV